MLADDNAIVDREVAYRAGLGWYGKNANLLALRCGQLLRARLHRHQRRATTPAEPVADGCGSCRRCLDACPTGAIVADGVIDANRCLAWILQRPGSIPVEYRAAIGDRIYGCDDCQTACPPTVRLGRRHRASSSPHPRRGSMPSICSTPTTTTLLARHGRWYIAGRDPTLVAPQRTRRARQRRRSRRRAVPAVAPIATAARCRPGPRRDGSVGRGGDHHPSLEPARQ